MAACSKGFLNIVQGLHGCPFLDINHQDSEGNTALMIASQAGTDGLRNFTKRRLLLLFTPSFPLNVLGSAGHVNTVMYLLNYYSGIDTEVQDCRGFTALIKAAMTGRTDVVATLVMAGT